MNRYVDFKSFIIGILITICIVLVMGSVSSSGVIPYGRFQLVIRQGNTTTPSGEFVIDTSTGQVWRSVDNRENFLAPKIHMEKVNAQPDSTVEK